jgi:ATP:ADP antiporter, AAA family
VLLADLFDKITPYDLHPREKISFSPADRNSPIFIVAHGEVVLKENDTVQLTLKPGDVFGNVFSQHEQQNTVNRLEATERSVVFRINTFDFYFRHSQPSRAGGRDHPECNINLTETTATNS